MGQKNEFGFDRMNKIDLAVNPKANLNRVAPALLYSKFITRNKKIGNYIKEKPAKKVKY